MDLFTFMINNHINGATVDIMDDDILLDEILYRIRNNTLNDTMVYVVVIERIKNDNGYSLNYNNFNYTLKEYLKMNRKNFYKKYELLF